jgi:RNA polymerase sigma-70 factor (ECF subfamily)
MSQGMLMDTSVSLLDRLAADPNDEDWRRLVELYRPLLRAWMARARVADADADDLTQDVLLVVFREVKGFQRRGPGTFRGWLRTILANRVRNHFRARHYRPTATGDSEFLHQLGELESPNSSLSALWDREHDEHVVATLLRQVRGQVEPATWEAFRRHVLEGAPAALVAEELLLSLNSVLLAKSRVLKRLRSELGDLID